MLRHLSIGVREGSGVPFLARRLVLLVGFFACSEELFAVSHVEVTGVGTLKFSMNLVDA